MAWEEIPYQASVTLSATASTKLLDRRDVHSTTHRNQWYINNTDGTNGVWLGIGVPAVIGRGIFVPANNGYYLESDTPPWYCTQLDINAIGAAGTPAVAVFERVVQKV